MRSISLKSFVELTTSRLLCFYYLKENNIDFNIIIAMDMK